MEDSIDELRERICGGNHASSRIDTFAALYNALPQSDRAPRPENKKLRELHEFEDIEAVVAAEIEGDDVDATDLGEDTGTPEDLGEVSSVLQDLSRIGSTIAARRGHFAVVAAEQKKEPVQRLSVTSSKVTRLSVPAVINAGRCPSSTPGGEALSSTDVTRLLRYSLNNPVMRQMATEALCAAQLQTAKPSRPAENGTEVERSPVLHREQKPAADPVNSATTAISSALATAITKQQQTLHEVFDSYVKRQEEKFAKQKEELLQAQADMTGKTEQLVRKEVASIRRHHQDLIQRYTSSKPMTGGSSMTQMPGHHQPSDNVITIHSVQAVKGNTPSVVLPSPLPSQTAQLVAEALAVERQRMAEERDMWLQSMRRQEKDASRHHAELEKRLAAASIRSETRIERSTKTATERLENVSEKQLSQVTQLIKDQQRAQLAAIREHNRPVVSKPIAGAVNGGLVDAKPSAPAAAPANVVASERKRHKTASAAANAASATRVSTGAQVHLQPHVVSAATQSALTPVRQDKKAGPSRSSSPLSPQRLPSSSEIPSSEVGPLIAQTEAELRRAGLVASRNDSVNAVPETPLEEQLKPIFLVTPPADATASAEGHHNREPLVSCVEMCVASFISEERSDKALRGWWSTDDPHCGPVSHSALSSNDKNACRLLTREEAEMLIDARRRLERIRQFSVSPETGVNGTSVVHCIVGEGAEALLLDTVTRGLIHEVIAEDVRKMLKARMAAQDEVTASSTTDVSFTQKLFPLCGIAAVDKQLTEECILEHIAGLVRQPSLTANHEAQRKPSPLSDFEKRLLLTIAEEMAAEQLFRAPVDGCAQPAATQTAVVVSIPSVEPAWLADAAPAAQVAQVGDNAPAAAPPSIVNVHVDTAAIGAVFKDCWQQLLTAAAPIAAQHQSSSASVAPPPLNPTPLICRTCEGEASRHPQCAEELPSEAAQPINAARSQSSGPLQVENATSLPSAATLIKAGVTLDDLEAMLVDRVMRKIQSCVSVHQPKDALDVSGVSSSSGSSTSSESACLQPTVAQAIMSDEAVVRHRFYSDVDRVFQLLRHGMLNEHADVQLRLDQQAASAVASQKAKIAEAPVPTLPSKEEVATSAAAETKPAAPSPAPPHASATAAPIKDPVTALIVDWFRQQEPGQVSAATQPQPAVQPHIAAPFMKPPDDTTSDSMLSSTHPSSFDAQTGMHRFVTYMPPDFFEALHRARHPRGSEVRHCGGNASSDTTMTTLYDESTATTVTSLSTHSDHLHRIHADESSTSSGTNTTVSSLSAGEIRRLRAEQALRAVQWPTGVAPVRQRYY